MTLKCSYLLSMKPTHEGNTRVPEPCKLPVKIENSTSRTGRLGRVTSFTTVAGIAYLSAESCKMTSSMIDTVLEKYKSIVRNPTLSGARILRTSTDGLTVRSTWTQRNLDRRATQSFAQEHALDPSFEIISESFPVDVSTELAAARTDDEERGAVLRQATVDGTAKQFIEIWDKRQIVKNYDLSALDVHGDVYTDSEFGVFRWSPDQTKLLYIAEKKLTKSEPFYKQAAQAAASTRTDSEEVTRGNEYVFKPHWGEQLVGKHRPVIVVLDTEADTVTVLTGVPDGLSPGQVLWTPDGEAVVGVAWKHEPRYLGLLSCTNRDSWIFQLKNGEYTKLSSDECAVRAPRFNPDGTYLVWLERSAGGPHHNAHRLMAKAWGSSEETAVETIVDVINVGITIDNEKQFYGLYNLVIPQRCWSSDSKYLFLSTAQRANTKSYAINIETKVTTEIENDTSSLSILDIKGDAIAFLRTSFVEQTRLELGRFDGSASNIGAIDRIEITTPGDIEGLETLKYEFIEHLYENDDEVKQFNSIYFGPRNGETASIPLIIIPHGGPHTSTATAFTLDPTLFALLGFGVLAVNYRGSTGMGARNVEYLQGKVGEADVLDCVTATQEAIQTFPWLDPSRMALYGASHGGFLVTHLSGQYPTLYKAVVARNPVIDIAAMFTITDIPDWCPAVTGFTYYESVPQPLGTEMFVKMFESSPIVHADKVRTPTLICIGTSDLRVPSSQGKLWFNRLKANDVATKLLVYEDNHSLATGAVQIDNIINAALWILEYTSGDSA